MKNGMNDRHNWDGVGERKSSSSNIIISNVKQIFNIRKMIEDVWYGRVWDSKTPSKPNPISNTFLFDTIYRIQQEHHLGADVLYISKMENLTTLSNIIYIFLLMLLNSTWLLLSIFLLIQNSNSSQNQLLMLPSSVSFPSTSFIQSASFDYR